MVRLESRIYSTEAQIPQPCKYMHMILFVLLYIFLYLFLVVYSIEYWWYRMSADPIYTYDTYDGFDLTGPVDVVVRWSCCFKVFFMIMLFIDQLLKL